MTTYLLDANVLIALGTDGHTHGPRAQAWHRQNSAFALCPTVEGAFARYAVREQCSIADVQATIRGFLDGPHFEFWPDDVSYADADLSEIRGHQQVTDAYLVALARAHGGKLATMDVSLAALYPDAVELIP